MGDKSGGILRDSAAGLAHADAASRAIHDPRADHGELTIELGQRRVGLINKAGFIVGAIHFDLHTF